MEESKFRVIKSIDIRIIEAQIDRVEKEVFNFTDSCVLSNCTWDRRRGSLYVSETKRLRHDLNSVYALMGKYRSRRGIFSAAGSAYKIFYGSMDSDDAITQMIMQNIGMREDKLHSSMSETVSIMTNMTKQWELMKENQENQLKNFVDLKKLLIHHLKSQKERQWEFDFKMFEVHLDSLILSVEVQIEKLRNAILFLKSGVIHPFLFDGDEVLNTLTYEKVRYIVSPKDIDAVLSNSRPVALFDSEKSIIHIIFLFPIASQQSYYLYENLIIPKASEEGIVVLDNISQYLAVSVDHTRYANIDTLTCFILSDVRICKPIPMLNVGFDRDCLVDLFFQNTDVNCVYKKLHHDLQIHNVLNTGLIVHSSSMISVDLSCQNFSESLNISGSYLIQPPPNCLVNSSYFEYQLPGVVEETKLNNRYPLIICCSTYFTPIVLNQTNNSSSKLILRSLHEIRSLNGSKAAEKLLDWKTFHMEIKDTSKHYGWLCLGLIAIIVLYVYYRLRCNNEPTTSTVIHFNQLGQDEVNHNFASPFSK